MALNDSGYLNLSFAINVNKMYLVSKKSKNQEKMIYSSLSIILLTGKMFCPELFNIFVLYAMLRQKKHGFVIRKVR